MAITRSQIARQLLAEGGAPRQGFNGGGFEGSFNSSPSVTDTGDLGTEAANIAANEAARSYSGGDGGDDSPTTGEIFPNLSRITPRSLFKVSADNPMLHRSLAERGFLQMIPGIGGAINLGEMNAFNLPAFRYSRTGGGIDKIINDENESQDSNRIIRRPIMPTQPTQPTQAEKEFAVRFFLPEEYRLADGGDVRQNYGLGKLVKKATRAVKKVVKSDVGKAAIAAGLGSYALGLGPFSAAGKFGGLKGAGFAQGLFPSIMDYKTPTRSFFTELGKGIGKIPGGGATAAILGVSALAGMTAPKEEQESLSQRIADRTGLDIAAIRKEVQDAYAAGDISGLRTKYPFLIPTTAAAAEGGRIGFENGGKSKEYDFEDYLKDRKRIDEFFDRENKFKQFKEDMLRFKKTREVTAANGGIMMASNLENEEVLESLFEKYLEMGLSPKDAADKARQEFDKMSKAKKSDRIMAKNGGEISIGQIEMLIKRGADNDLIKTYIDGVEDGVIDQIRESMKKREKKQDGGLMNLAGNEMDLRGGGFVPIGRKEKADDVPARLSKNEFVFTADAVRAAGGGSVDRGADLMYKTMKQLENKVA